MTDITIVYTHAAQTFAATRGGMEELEIAARSAVLKLQQEGCKDLEKIMFSTFGFHGRYNMIMIPRDGGMLVDINEPETSEEPLKEGPFKGMKVVMPRPFSEDL